MAVKNETVTTIMTKMIKMMWKVEGHKNSTTLTPFPLSIQLSMEGILPLKETSVYSHNISQSPQSG